MKEAKEVITEFHELVNMTAKELKDWLTSDDSRSAGWPKENDDGESVGHESGRKIIEILESNSGKDPEKYTDDQIGHMRKVVSYCKRHLAQEEKANNEKPLEEVEKSKSYASLKNWGHDCVKKREDKPGKTGGGADDAKAGKKREAAEAKQPNENKKRKTEKEEPQVISDDEGDDEDAEGEEEPEAEEQDGEQDEKEDKKSGGKGAKGPAKGDTVSWNWGGGQPEGKVLDVKHDEASITTKRGNEVSRKGKPDDPAVVLDTGKSKALKLDHELNKAEPAGAELAGAGEASRCHPLRTYLSIRHSASCSIDGLRQLKPSSPALSVCWLQLEPERKDSLAAAQSTLSSISATDFCFVSAHISNLPTSDLTPPPCLASHKSRAVRASLRFSSCHSAYHVSPEGPPRCIIARRRLIMTPPRIEPSIRMRRAICAGDALLVKRILKSHPGLLHNPDTSAPGLSNSNLHLAASLGHKDVCEVLLDAGHENPCPALNEHHQTALMLAAGAGHTEVVHLLCERDCDCILRRDVRGRDAVMEASAGGHDTILQLLLTYIPGGPYEAVQRADAEGNTALHFASGNGNLLGLRTLLAAGADVEKRNFWNWTPAAYSATVQAEVYLKGLVTEVGRIQQQQLRIDSDTEKLAGSVRAVPGEGEHGE